MTRCAGRVPVPMSSANGTVMHHVLNHVAGGPPASVSAAGEIVLNLRRRRSWETNRRGSRVYLAGECDDAARQIDPRVYSGWNVLGQTLSFTVELAKSGCGCVAAAYLVPMQANREAGTCGGDHYCDANRICGVGCSEIDVMEANSRAFLSTTHTLERDCYGKGGGLGGTNRAFSSREYGPSASIIDTLQPFRVHAYFAADTRTSIELSGLEITLEQASRTLRFQPTSSDCLPRHTAAMSRATLVFSYWSAPSSNLSWFDRAPCETDDQDTCGNSVHISKLQLRPGKRFANRAMGVSMGSASSKRAVLGKSKGHPHAAAAAVETKQSVTKPPKAKTPVKGWKAAQRSGMKTVGSGMKATKQTKGSA